MIQSPVFYYLRYKQYTYRNIFSKFCWPINFCKSQMFRWLFSSFKFRKLLGSDVSIPLLVWDLSYISWQTNFDFHSYCCYCNSCVSDKSSDKWFFFAKFSSNIQTSIFIFTRVQSKVLSFNNLNVFIHKFYICTYDVLYCPSFSHMNHYLMKSKFCNIFDCG